MRHILKASLKCCEVLVFYSQSGANPSQANPTQEFKIFGINFHSRGAASEGDALHTTVLASVLGLHLWRCS